MIMITTERLILRNFKTDDYPDFVKLIQDKMASDWHVYDSQWPVDNRQLMYSLAYVIKHDYWFAIELKEEKRVIGYAVAGVTDDGSSCDIGYTLHSAYQRKGYAYEACKAIMQHRASDGRLRRFTAGTADCNYPSRGLLAKLGFEYLNTELVSFAKDADGKPIAFWGGNYECSADKWR